MIDPDFSRPPKVPVLVLPTAHIPLPEDMPNEKLESVANRIVRETIETWENRVREGQEAMVESHRESLPKLSRAGLTYGEQSISAYLTSRLNEENRPLRRAATRALGQIATNDTAAVETVLDQLDDEDPSMRHEAAAALGEIGTFDQEIIERLTTGIENGPPEMRHGAAVALGRVASDEPEVVESLVDQLSDDKMMVRIAAAQTLSQIDVNKRSITEGLVELLNSHPFEDPVASRVAAEVLGWIDTGQPTVTDALVDRLKRKKELIHEEIADVFRAHNYVQMQEPFTPRAPTSSAEKRRKILYEWFTEHGWTELETFEKLEQMAKDEDPDVPDSVVVQIQEDNQTVRQAAAEALGRIGRKDPEVTEALVDCLEDEDFMVRSEAAEALSRIGAGSSAVNKALINCLDDRAYVRNAVVEALGRIGTDNSAVTEALIKRLSDENLKVRQASIKALGRISPDEPWATEALATKLRGGSQEERTLAAEALTRLGVQKPKAVRHLIDQVVRQNGTETRRAAEVLAGLPWYIVSEEYMGRTRADLSEESFSRIDWPAAIFVEEGEYAAVHWQALARLPE